jgi:hypothetical protein
MTPSFSLSESASNCGAVFRGRAVTGSSGSLGLFCSSKEFGGEGGVFAGACWALATIEAAPLLGFMSYCWMLKLRPTVKRVAVGP